MLWTGYADSVIGCFAAKYTYGFWQPVTAIPAGGGNSALQADPAWLPLGTTPNHPEYPAAHGCITGVVSKRPIANRLQVPILPHISTLRAIRSTPYKIVAARKVNNG